MSINLMAICKTGEDGVANSTGDRRKLRPVPKPKKPALMSNLKGLIQGKSSVTEQPKFRKAYSASNSPASIPTRQSGVSMTLPKPPPKPSPQFHREGLRNQTSASSSSHGESHRNNGSREAEGYQIRAPPPGSYQDDDTGPSPKNLVMAVMAVKSAVNHFAKVLISDMNKHPVELEYLKQSILRELNSQVERVNHWKFLVQAFICQRLFEGFDTPNGYFGIEFFENDRMSSISSFQDFSKFKDKAATISTLMDLDSPDLSFLGRYCFKKFKSISGELASNQPLPLYKEEWYTVDQNRHPKSAFYQSFLKVAVSVWLLHRLVHGFEQKVEMLTYEKGVSFQRKNMESVVPGSYEEEDEESDVHTEVGFSVIPGFQVSRSVVKCEVYLHNKNKVHPEMETTVGRPSSIKSPVKLNTSTDKSPVKPNTSTDKSPVIPSSNKTKTPPKHSEMLVSDHHSSRSFHTPEGVPSYSSYADHVPPRGGDDAAVKDADNYWALRRDSLSLGNQGVGSRSGRQSRTGQESVGEAHVGSRTSTYNLAAPLSKNSRPPYYYARDNKTSASRRHSNTRHSPSG